MLYFQPHEQEGHMYVDWAYLGNLGLWIVVRFLCSMVRRTPGGPLCRAPEAALVSTQSWPPTTPVGGPLNIWPKRSWNSKGTQSSARLEATVPTILLPFGVLSLFGASKSSVLPLQPGGNASWQPSQAIKMAPDRTSCGSERVENGTKIQRTLLTIPLHKWYNAC